MNTLTGSNLDFLRIPFPQNNFHMSRLFAKLLTKKTTQSSLFEICSISKVSVNKRKTLCIKRPWQLNVSHFLRAAAIRM